MSENAINIFVLSELPSGRYHIKRAMVNFIAVIIAFVDFIFLTLTGLLIHYILPPHSRRATIWGMTRHEWGDIHFMLALVFIAVMAIHIYLHWAWIKGMFMGKHSTVGTDSCS